MERGVKMILADASGAELRYIADGQIDVELGGDNDFLVTFPRSAWRSDIADGSRLYIPGTEYGGIVRRIETDTAMDTIAAGGLTWRGMLAHKIIRPAPGADYATATGDVGTILGGYVETEFPGLFVGGGAAGVSVGGFQFARYCTLLDGLSAMLATVGYRLHIEYSEGAPGVSGQAVVSAVPIVDYSQTVELSENAKLNYKAVKSRDGVNHLVCLGKGELAERVVVDLYTDAAGNISTVQTFTGAEEIAEVYDNSGAELEDLTEGGKQRLAEIMSKTSFSMDVAALDLEGIEIGDVIGGRDYLSGIYMTKPVTGKVYKFDGSAETIEYSISDEQ